MKRLVSVFVALVLLSAGLPAQAAPAKYSVYQKTLAAFGTTSTALTASQRAEVRKALSASPDAEKFICTGIRLASQPTAVNILVRKRAKAACDYAKQLRPSLSVWFQTKPTNAPSYAGKVLLTVKSPLSIFAQVEADIRSFRKSAVPMASLEGFESFASTGVDPKVFAHYRAMVSKAAGFWAQFNDGKSIVKSVNVLGWGAGAEANERSDALGMPGFADSWWWRAEATGGGTVGKDDDGNSHVFFRLNKAGGDFPYDDYAYHEVTHSYQYFFLGDAFSGSTPCWFPEGYAMVVGLASSFDNAKENARFYAQERRLRADAVENYLSESGSSLNAELDKVLQYTHDHPQCNTLEPLFGYRLGMLVSEAWIWEFGFERTISFLQSAESNDFSEAFEAEFGISMKDWLATKAKPYVLDAFSE